jgi:predicted alpha/beta superfamily hydrolase
MSYLFSQKITIVLETKSEDNISNYFFASNLNGWSPSDSSFKFSQLSSNKYKLLIDDFKNINHIEYKITKGAWHNVECNADGSQIQNRYFVVDKIKKDTTLNIKVDFWRNDFESQHPKSSASKNVKILSNEFYLKSLGVKRRVWIYLPANYDSSKEKYKVLYMHDGQNLFDVLTGPFGEWGVDEALDSLNKNLIVIGIDNGSAERLSEYSAFDFKVNADAKNVWDVKAKGKLYLESIVNDLMPFVESNYRVKRGKANTFIAGSSMGGLISYYALFLYPDKFSKAGVFSPSFWVAKEQYYQMTLNYNKKLGDIYMIAGELEGRSYINDMNDFVTLIKKKNQSNNIFSKEIKNAQHNEQFWRSQLPNFIKWLM